MAASDAAAKPKREMKVLALGLPRTGSASIAAALTVLGYKDVYHGLKAIDSMEDWWILNRAADATYTTLPGYTGKPFTRAEWDELYGSCEATTDVAAVFAPQLIEVYPEAKVLLVVREFEKWYPSINVVFEQMHGIGAWVAMNLAEPLLGSRASIASRKLILGYFEADSFDGARANARATYDRHHAQVRKMVPADNLLEYRMGDGWGPLCEFLGRPVPDEEFPWVNEAAQLKEIVKRKIKQQCTDAAKIAAPWVVGVGAVGFGAWFAMNKGSVN